MAESCSLMIWARSHIHLHPELDLLYHIPNEAKRTPFVGRLMKAMGMKPGVWDYHLPMGQDLGGVHLNGLWIEMKSKGKQLTPEQKEWGEKMLKANHAIARCYGWLNARQALLDYLTGNAGSTILQWRT